MRILIAMTTWAAMTAAKDLAEAGFLVTRAEDGTDLLEYADLSEQNAILFDADLPDMEASACLKQLRRVRPDAAIVLLVPPGARATATRALADGADDVVTYGTDARELAARVQAVARRRAGLSDPVVQFGDLTLDIARQRASVGIRAGRIPCPAPRPDRDEGRDSRAAVCSGRCTGIEDHWRLCLPHPAEDRRAGRRSGRHLEPARPRLRACRDNRPPACRLTGQP